MSAKTPMVWMGGGEEEPYERSAAENRKQRKGDLLKRSDVVRWLRLEAAVLGRAAEDADRNRRFDVASRLYYAAGEVSTLAARLESGESVEVKEPTL